MKHDYYTRELPTIDIETEWGLPITVRYDWDEPDLDNGILCQELISWEITHVKGRKCLKRPNTLYAVMDDRFVFEAIEKELTDANY